MTFRELYNIFAKHKDGQWIMKLDNAYQLYQFAKENNIKRVLGLGTGIGLSDAVIALALLEKGEKDFLIDSLEQNEKCINIANGLIPQELKGYINIHKTEVKVWNTEHIPYQYFSNYKTLPNSEYDLIINDGPSPFMEGDKYVDLPNGTIHEMLINGKIKDGTKIIYDGRVQSFGILERYFSGNFQLIKVPKRGNDFNVIEKIGDLKIGDDKLDMMKNFTTYFK